jgi:TPR repeat protein
MWMSDVLIDAMVAQRDSLSKQRMTNKKYILLFGIFLVCGCAPKLREWKPHHIDNAQAIPFQTSLDETVIKIPFKIPDKHILLQATINREKTVWFLLDTGMGAVVLSKRIAKNMDLPFSKNTAMFIPPSGKAYFSPLLRLNSLKVGGAKFNEFDAIPLDLRDLRRHLKHEVDGILGFSLFANILLTIDYPQQTIFLQKGRLPVKGKEIFDYYVGGYTPYLPIPWKDNTIPAVIYTGSGSFLQLPKVLAKGVSLRNSTRERIWDIERTRYDLTGILDEIQIGQYLISYPRINFAEMPRGILGYVFLHHFAITFDQVQRKVRIIKPGATREKTEIYQDALSLWQKREAETGEASIQYHLGWMYHKGYGVEKDITQAIRWYQKAAEKGWAQAQFNLGLIYFLGENTQQDYEKANKWFYMAAKQGHTAAQDNLGFLYLNGYGVSQNHGQALHWFQKAALEGESNAQLNLGVMYAKGTGVEQDYQEALLWFMKSAEQGNAKAQGILGALYAKGFGVKQDYQLAFQWFKRSADQNNPEAQYNLGLMYEQGLGTNQDIRIALIWYHKAAEQGHLKAQQALERLEDKDTSIKLDWGIKPFK